MGCIFSCFGFNGDSDTPRSVSEEVVRLNQDQTSLFLPFLSKEYLENPSAPTEEKRKEESEFYFEKLKEEAQFLKACGTICEIPAEIQEVVEQNEFSSHKGDVGSLKLKSWLTSTSVENLDLEIPPDHSPIQSTNCGEWIEEFDLPHTPSSEESSPNSTVFNELTELLSSPNQSPKNSSLSTCVKAPSTLKKSVRFNCETSSFSARSPSETSSQTSDESESSHSFTYRKSSPYPTPLKLVDEMETPGTIFPAYMDGIGQGKNPRIRSQFVRSVVHPAENLLFPCDPVNKVIKREPLVEIDGYVNSGVGENFHLEKELNLEASLSPWLRGGRPNNQGALTLCQDQNSEVGSTPILGVASSSQYKGDESLSIIPKWREWNGIPNTTNKYKEDKKVKWHATPFEERLEKALSEDAVIAKRNHSSNGCQQMIL